MRLRRGHATDRLLVTFEPGRRADRTGWRGTTGPFHSSNFTLLSSHLAARNLSACTSNAALVSALRAWRRLDSAGPRLAEIFQVEMTFGGWAGDPHEVGADDRILRTVTQPVPSDNLAAVVGIRPPVEGTCQID